MPKTDDKSQVSPFLSPLWRCIMILSWWVKDHSNSPVPAHLSVWGKKKKIVERGPSGDWGWGGGGGHLPPSLSTPLSLSSPSLPSVPQKPFLCQARGKYFGRVVETGLLFFSKTGSSCLLERLFTSKDVTEPGSYRMISRCLFSGWYTIQNNNSNNNKPMRAR